MTLFFFFVITHRKLKLIISSTNTNYLIIITNYLMIQVSRWTSSSTVITIIVWFKSRQPVLKQIKYDVIPNRWLQ